MASKVTEISQSDIGKRVTVRLRDGDGYRDIVGILQTPTSLINRHGQLIDFDPKAIHIWREIIDKPRTATSGAPLSIRIFELETAMAKTWRAKEEELIGGWLFRADVGITRRANSALVLNHDSNFEHQIDELINWYRKRNLNPSVTLFPILHGSLDEELANRGFEHLHDSNVLVKDPEEYSVDFEYQCTKQPSDEWLSVQGDQKLADLFNRSDAKYLSLRQDGRIIAIGRIAFAEEWAVVSRIWVIPEIRGKGFGRKILTALEMESEGLKIALQVESKNQIAINLYESMGYKTHHVYRIRELRQQTNLIPNLAH